jgi:FtsP/CotA-like multicopper oxidase with cupredoxin domain
VLNNATTFDDSAAVIELATADEVYYLVIETTLAVPHPIHIHVS